MEVPNYSKMYGPLLKVIGGGDVHEIKDAKPRIAKILGLDKAALSRKLNGGKRTVYNERLAWARKCLKNAGLIVSPHFGAIQITEEGKKLLQSGVQITDELLSKKYPSSSEQRDATKETCPVQPGNETPQETIEIAYKKIDDNLKEELLEEIMKHSAEFFEQLVVDLMKAMNYGDGFKTRLNKDGGIDGIIYQDVLGFNLIYTQAKRWKRNRSVSSSDIQDFADAIATTRKPGKGLFVTTTKFSENARKLAEAKQIIPIDGEQLAELMIKYGVGVSVQNTYRIKRIDSNYFDEDL